jgi:hypothetical protein
MGFKTEEYNKKKLEEVISSKLPQEEEILILENGILISDEESSLDIQELGEEVCEPILCGC